MLIMLKEVCPPFLRELLDHLMVLSAVVLCDLYYRKLRVWVYLQNLLSSSSSIKLSISFFVLTLEPLKRPFHHSLRDLDLGFHLSAP